ncbi:MAG: PQQ-binding-like beta-propeller repeat protein, partial [bacterium]
MGSYFKVSNYRTIFSFYVLLFCLLVCLPISSDARIPGQRVWTFQFEDFSNSYGLRPISMVPAVSPEGTIYVSAPSSKKGLQQALYALNQDGSLKWKTEYAPAGIGVQSIPSVSGNGTIYVTGMRSQTGAGRKLYSVVALTAQGELMWKSPVKFVSEAMTVGYLSIGPDGTIYTRGRVKGDTATSVVALDEDDGSLKWKYPLDSSKTRY